MSKPKKKRKGKVPAHLKKYLFKSKKRRNPHKKGKKKMAKRKKRSGGRRRRYTRRARRAVHRGAGTLGGGGWSVDIGLIASGAAAGWMEKAIKKGRASGNEADKHFLDKIPHPIDALGVTGNVALFAYGASYLLPAQYKRYARIGARGLATIAAYQMMRQDAAFKKGDDLFTLSGLHPDALGEGDEQTISDASVGELEDELGRRFHVEADVDTDAGDHHEGAVHPDEIHPDDSHAPPA